MIEVSTACFELFLKPEYVENITFSTWDEEKGAYRYMREKLDALIKQDSPELNYHLEFLDLLGSLNIGNNKISSNF